MDELIQIERGKSGRGKWTVAGDEAFFAGHFPGNPIVPGVLIAEALAQLSGLVAAEVDDPESNPGLLLRSDVRFKRAVVPPADIHLP